MENWIVEFGIYAMEFGTQLLDGGSRLFVGYLVASLVAAMLIYRHRKVAGGLREFLFPRSVWDHPDAWLDVRYFAFHGLIGHFVMRGLVVAALVAGLTFTSGGAIDPSDIPTGNAFGTGTSFVLAAALYLGLVVVGDFAAFVMHLLQHRIPLLWQFHKVHHSGEVMHPLSNFREHPVDNIAYKLLQGFVHGAALGACFAILGIVPGTPLVFGIAVASLVFNSVAYSLRHSHIWLRWPGRWSMVYGSPAHHQVHHSRHPDHLDTNFAFQFPIWDVIFGTYCMPEDNRDVEFGIVEDASELDSCVNLYVVPFRHAWQVLTGRRAAYGEKPVEPDFLEACNGGVTPR